ARSVGRERRLAGAGETEKHRRSFRTDVRRTVHRHDAFGRQEVIEQAEYAFLHLAGIGRAADEDQLLAVIDGNHRLAAATVPRGIGAEAWQVDYRIFGREMSQLVGARAHQHGADEQVVPGELVNDAHVDAVLRLRAAEQVGNVERLLLAQGL